MATLHQQAVALAPAALDVKENLVKPNRIIIAVLRHDSEAFVTNTGKEIDRFLWIKGRDKITVARVREVYLQQYGDPTLGLRFLHGNEEPSLETRMDDLEPRFGAGDQHVTLRAVPDDEGNAITPTSTAFTPSRSCGKTSDDRSPRRPLQPIIRQTAVPAAPKDSPKGSMKRESSDTTRHLDWNRENYSTPLQHTNAAPTPHPTLQSHPKPAWVSPTFGQPAWIAINPSPANTSEVHMHQSVHYRPTIAPNLDANRGGLPPVISDTQEDEGRESPYKPRQVENPFTSSNATDGVDDPQETEDVLSQERGLCLHSLTKEESTEKLEAAVQQGLAVLSELERPLNKLPDNGDATGWLQQIQDLRKQAVRTRTIVGVVGNTGAGKSSVINAMLDEERLVPTNCMRACTAVVTEMSWNDAKSEMSRYRAEIEFIQPEDWLKELKILFKEAFDDEGRMLREAANAETEAGVAATKIRAVYHKYTKEMLGTSTPEKLMQVKKVQSVLGTTRSIRSGDAASFYRQLQGYVDSKGKEELDKNGNKKTNPHKEFEYWPLIKVVRIYTKADALSTGAVIVDLPGVHDSNAARSAVAAGYMKQCTGLWIVAPINRAVDDKAAKHLLGETFKRQLKYDAMWSAVTFICSKTDDISKTEAIDSLKLGAETRDMDDELESIERQLKKNKKDTIELKAKREDYGSAIDDIENQLEQWEPLEEAAESGKTVYAPTTKRQQNKRKRSSVETSKSTQTQKRRRITLGSDDSNHPDSDSGSDEWEDPNASNNEDCVEKSVVLALEEVQTKIKELRQLKKDTRKERAKMDDDLMALRRERASMNDRYEELETEQTLLCINERNEYSRRNIQLDFAQGIKELDQENAAEEDPDNFDPEEDIRDYDQVADSLPVFTVSSRAYQKLSGRMKKDNDVPGFKSARDTEIPQLQVHCKKLTEKGRQATCRRFLNSLHQLMNSMSLWASDDGSGLKLTAQQRGAEENFLARKLKELEKALEKCVKNVCEDMVSTLNEQIFEKLNPAVDAAARAALPTAQGWGAHRNDGGMVWASYKATCRRNGVFRMDFNQQLTDPMYKHLASTWEKAFQRRLPVILNSFSRSASTLLRAFHASVETRSRECGLGIARIGMLGNQLKAHEAYLCEIATTMIGSLNEGQREINREFTPIILAAMTPAYEYCTNERGTGSYKRMKDGMISHVEQNCKLMFDNAANQVTESLQKMCKQVQKNMLDRADALFVIMKRDYMTMLGGANASQQVILPREERVMRREIDDAIDKTEALFRVVMDGSEEELKALVGPVAAGTNGTEGENVEMQSEADDISDEGQDSDKEKDDKDSGEEQDDFKEGSSAGSGGDEDGNSSRGSDLD